MKEIIEYGNITTKYTTTCPFCLCSFTYQKEDVFISNYGLGLPMTQCPACGKPFNASIGPDLGGFEWKMNSK